jgi:WD40 repeat protein
MFIKLVSICKGRLGWGVGCVLLVGLGFALHATLPPQPRFVLRGERFVAGAISADGGVVAARTYQCDADEVISGWGPLTSWDTMRGTERGVFFRGLIGAHGIRGRDDLDERDYRMDDLVFSPDRRYCALVHRDGLALADLQAGREWPRVVESTFADYACPESVAVHRWLQEYIDPKPLEEGVKLKSALGHLSDSAGGKLIFVLDRETLAADAGEGAPDPYEEEVRLPPIKLTIATALRILASQISGGSAGYVIRKDRIEITTWRHIRDRQFWPPFFSPRSSFVAFAEGGKEHDKLHVVERASGQRIATFSLPVPGSEDAWERFGFTPDDELLYFFSDQGGVPALTVWSLRDKQVARTFEKIALHGLCQLAPDGESLLVENVDKQGELLNLRTGERRPMAGTEGLRYAMFSPDGRTLVCHASEKLTLWDVPTVPTGKIRTQIALDWLQSPLVISADSQVVVCGAADKRQSFTAWSLQSGARLWPPPKPKQVEQNENGAVVQEFFEGGGLLSRADMSPGFTPDRRFLVQRKENRINMLDPATGTVHASLVMDRDAKDPAVLGFAPNGRWMVSQWDYAEREPWFGEEWLAKWLPIRKKVGRIVVSETATGRVQLCVNTSEAGPAHAVLSGDGATLMTSMWQGDSTEVACWDVPGRPSLVLVIGIPLALGCAGVLIRWWFVRKRKPSQPIPLV